jgi:hypothetical protein
MKQHPIGPKKAARNPNRTEEANVHGHLIFQLFRGIALGPPPMFERIVDPLHGLNDIPGSDHGEKANKKNPQRPIEADLVEGMI